MPENETLLKINDLSRSLNHNGTTINIIVNFSYSFRKGKIYTILGPSGSGKSSLLRLINRLDENSGGSILFHNKNIIDFIPCELRCRIGYLFQIPYLFEGSVRDNIKYGCSDLGDEKTKILVERTHLKPEMLDREVDNLSIGEKQRVALARLLANNPEILLLDEPTSALDPTHTDAIENLIKEIVNDRQITALMVTHHPEQALRMGGETILMVEGRLIESGSSNDVINNPQTELGKKYREKKLK